jgi:uncharacterized protein YqeY
MTLKEQIQADKVFSQKYGIKVLNLLLSTVLGELDRKTKTPTDDETISVIKKMVENLKLCNNEIEAEMLNKYLPNIMSDDELKNIIDKFCIENAITEKRQMGLVMKFLKENFNGQYDGKVASTVISNILK